jgi:glycosyltransferase involved in cell wall biosynthesis
MTDKRCILVTKRKLSIAYFPFENESNRYTDNFKKILSGFGDIAEAPPLKRVLGSFIAPRFDILILNWSDNNFVNEKKGTISLFGVAKEFFRVAVYRIIARKLVFVRHNVYPHEARGGSRQKAMRLIELYEKCFDLCWVHSGHMAQERRMYVPHPLYAIEKQACTLHDRLQLPEKYFVVFGRIQPYKKIDSLIENLPDDLHIVVCGSCPDREYGNRLRAFNKSNVTLIAEFISDETARALILRSSGIVICHAEDDMIVSGSIVFAISLGVPVFAIETPFVAWFRDTVNPRMIVAASGFADLVDKMRRYRSQITDDDIASSQAHFSDQAVVAHVASTFERLELT